MSAPTASPTPTPTAPGALPLIGHGHRLARDPLSFVNSLRRHGSIVRIRIGPTPAYVITDPALTRRVLVDDATHYAKGGRIIDALRVFFGDGLATISDGDAHMVNRRRIQPMFNRNHIADRGDAMIDQVRAMVGSWGEGQSRDVFADMSEVTLSAFLTALFGTELPQGMADEFTALMPEIMRGTIRQTILPPWFTRLPLPANRAHAQRVARLRSLIDQAIDHVDATSSSGTPSTAASETAACPHAAGLFKQLLTLEEPLPRQQLQDEVITLLTGAIETTGTTLAWTLFELTQNHEVQVRLREELESVCGDRALRYQDLDHLPYARQVLQEAIRKYGPAWMVTRTATDNVDLGGHLIPAGADVVWSPYLHQHCPQAFPDPEKFDPDRWLPDRARDARGSFLAFGAGRRQCIGENFAWAELTIILETILQTWPLIVPTSRPPRPQAVVTVRPDTLTMAFYQRVPEGREQQ